jgi:two-component system nitrate/nitrite response regulator NarL
VEGKTAVVVDHHPLWLDAIEQALVTASVEMVAKTTSLAEATGLIEQLEPDLVVVELAIREGETTGLSWLAETSKRFTELKVIVLSSSDDPGEIEAALAGGASVYVVKRAHPADVAVAVRQVYERSLYLRRRQRPGTPSVPRRDEFSLTKREREILGLTAEGLSNKLIAKQLWVTEQTVKFHLSNIYSKLGVSNRTAASRVAQLHRLLPTQSTEEQPERGA